MEKPLTQEQYNIINEKRSIIDAIHHGADAMSPGSNWLLSMRVIYADIFYTRYPNISCRPCIIESLKRLHPKLVEYENLNLKTNESTSTGNKPESTTNTNGINIPRIKKSK